MAGAAARALIFRLGETGFLLDLEQLVEIYEELDECFDADYAVLDQGIIGALNFRRTQVPLVDPKLFLHMTTEHVLTGKSALVLKGDEGNWALLVDRVEEIVSLDRLEPCEVPLLLKNSVGGYCSQISLMANEPMVHLELKPFNSSAPVM